MTQQEFTTEAQVIAKGRFWKWILKNALPFIWENRVFILALLKKNEKEERENNKIQGLMAGCDKNRFDDPHYGEAGEYDRNCNWIPWT
jgi:hypothetical protein